MIRPHANFFLMSTVQLIQKRTCYLKLTIRNRWSVKYIYENWQHLQFEVDRCIRSPPLSFSTALWHAMRLNCRMCRVNEIPVISALINGCSNWYHISQFHFWGNNHEKWVHALWLKNGNIWISDFLWPYFALFSHFEFPMVKWSRLNGAPCTLPPAPFNIPFRDVFFGSRINDSADVGTLLDFVKLRLHFGRWLFWNFFTEGKQL